MLRLGDADVLAEGAELLAASAPGLLRLASPEGARPLARLTLKERTPRDWPLAVSESGGVHAFGRKGHLLEAAPASLELTLTFAPPLGADGVYWLRRDLFGALACLSGGLMLHGSAALHRGEAHVFCGPSGTGKSTLLGILASAGLEPVNDEVNWLFHDDAGTLRLVNQPYWVPGQSPSPPFPPVARIHLLRQAERCALKPPPHPAEIFGGLLACHLGIDQGGDFLERRSRALAKLAETAVFDVFEFNLSRTEILQALFGR